MKRQGGFTLIELVVVIVILGILAVTAAPRFLNLQDDARNSALQGLRGAIVGAAGISYGKAAVRGEETNAGPVNVDGVQTVFGYPQATQTGIGAAFENDDWDVITSADTSDVPATALNANQIIYTFDGRTTEGCYVIYTEATDANTPATAVVVEGEGCAVE
ncbi:type II secretion system protein [Photobacterium sp. GJ3]|uniref:prepilin-type N-terminal cleavage/methylation domain-containing protein n=1 Tax=Photobacterium sp. GJ3 TaxID=2829502 RepID=UPI001B8CBB77|nr:type II secretion system protein [Photobacterium sp. GJ3]QUJ67143.1 type II secretion system protein [Photobacterium sp. GJ3]